MSCTAEFIEYVSDQLSELGSIRCRKMFGDYGIYLDEKIFGLICDDVLYIKTTDAGFAFAPSLPLSKPYEGAKDYFVVENIDDREFICELVRISCEALPMPKPKKSKKA